VEDRFHLETAANLLRLLERVLTIFSKCALKYMNNQTDFDSAIRRFDPSRPSHRYYQASSILLPTPSLSSRALRQDFVNSGFFSASHVLRPHLSSLASGRLELKTESN
jgi:hypothetical protein